MASEHQRKRREHVEETLRRNQAAVDAAQQTMRELRDAGDRSERVAKAAAVATAQRDRRRRRAVWQGRLVDVAYLAVVVALLWLIFHFA